MAGRGPVEVVVTFGPTSSPLFPRAVGYASAHATTSAEVAPRVWRASFVLGTDPRIYGAAWRLLQLVRGWRATEVQVQGSPEPITPVEAMTTCARAWLRTHGACRAAFSSGPWPKCELCPLYDQAWAIESFAPPPFFPEEMPFGDLTER